MRPRSNFGTQARGQGARPRQAAHLRQRKAELLRRFPIPGKKRTLPVPKEMVEEVQRRVSACYRFQLAVGEVLTASAELPPAARAQLPCGGAVGAFLRTPSPVCVRRLGRRCLGLLHGTPGGGLHPPELLAAGEKRFDTEPPTRLDRDGKDRVEIWDVDDFDPWERLHPETVRLVRYRQHKPERSVVQADWFTKPYHEEGGSPALSQMAKRRREIKDQGFHDAKNRHGIEHICPHEANGVLLNWLITLLALVIERLCRIRDLHRGRHPVRSVERLCRLLWLALSCPSAPDSS